MTPQERADKARLSAAKRYRQHAKYLEEMGARLYPIDSEGARAIWLDGMKALDCAAKVLREQV